MDIRDVGSLNSAPALSEALKGKEDAGQGFVDHLKKSIQMVNEAQLKADQAVTDFESGRQQNLHETMIALQKADLSFQLMMQVRNKIISAYDEISKMQI